jgi:hypothetical protein
MRTHAGCLRLQKYTHSGCVILIALPLQQWLHERASMLRYTYTAGLFPFVHTYTYHNCPTYVRAEVTNKSACFCKFSFIHQKKCMPFCVFFYLQPMSNGPCQQDYERLLLISSSCSDTHFMLHYCIQRMHIHELYFCLASVIQVQ